MVTASFAQGLAGAAKGAVGGAVLGAAAGVIITVLRRRKIARRKIARRGAVGDAPAGTDDPWPPLSSDANVALLELAQCFTDHTDVLGALARSVSGIEHLVAQPRPDQTAPGGIRAALGHSTSAHELARHGRFAISQLGAVAADGDERAASVFAEQSEILETIITRCLFNVNVSVGN